MFLLQQSTHRMVMQYDPDVGHLYVPDLNARIPSETGGFRVVTNSQGFRSDVEFVPDRSDAPRILVFGDSFTAGDGCDNAERFSELIGNEFDAEVYNYAVSGTGTDQQLLIYEKFARNVQADLIIIGVYVENIERNLVAFRESLDRVSKRNVLIPKPYFTIEGGELTRRHVPVPLERPYIEEVDRERFQSVTRANDPLQRLLYEPLQRFNSNQSINAVRSAVKNRLPWFMPAMLRASGFQPYPDYGSAESAGWQLLEALLRRFITGVAPTPVLVVPLPHYYFYHDGIKPLYQPLIERLSAPEQGVHVVNVTQPLNRLPWPNRKRIAFKSDTHYSPYGHQQVARILSDFIRAHRLLPCRDAAPVSRKPSPPVVETPPPLRNDAPGRAEAPTEAVAHNTARSSLLPPRTAGTIYVLGISAFYHNSAAALIKDGEVVAAAEEERFSRIKNDRGFPTHAANYCLEEAGIDQNELAAVVYYDNAPLTFERLLHSIAAVGAEGQEAWERILPSWLRCKLHIPQLIRKHLVYSGRILHESHHRSHAASAFLPSPFDRAAIITMDGVGEWATGSIGVGENADIKLLKEMHFPHSLGLLYSAFTQFTGFKVNSGEYKMMGLAPYGEPCYVDRILDNLCELKEDGSIELNMEYFAFLSQPTMTNAKFAALFGGPARKPDDWLTRREMDIARSIQVVTEEVMLRAARYAHKLTGEKRLCLAGGVALNCVANGRLLREGAFEDIWIQPAAGDAGCALGAALDAYHTFFDRPRTLPAHRRPLQGGSFLGPSYSESEIKAFVETHAYPHTHLQPATRGRELASLLADGKVLGHFSGRLEFGPRSLGARAILGDARNPEMQQNLNLKIKYRESFRPFAPSVLAERVGDYFELDREAPYMLVVAPVRQERRKPFQREGADLTAIVRVPRSDLPAITHIDYSARVQTVAREDHPEYYDLIKAFEDLTGYGVIVNTSFNVRGEPIVCTPDDAYRCFMRTEMDYLVLGNYLLAKADQPPRTDPKGHLEAGDPPVMADACAPDLLRAIRSMFFSDFLPAVNSLSQTGLRVQTTRQNSPTRWIDVCKDGRDRTVFVVPPALDCADPEPVRMAEAITSYWEPGPATDALRRVLVKLLETNHRFPIEEKQVSAEKITDTIYVMH